MMYSEFCFLENEKRLFKELWKLEAEFRENGSKYHRGKIIDKINQILLFKESKGIASIDTSIIELKAIYETNLN